MRRYRPRPLSLDRGTIDAEIDKVLQEQNQARVLGVIGQPRQQPVLGRGLDGVVHLADAAKGSARHIGRAAPAVAVQALERLDHVQQLTARHLCLLGAPSGPLTAIPTVHLLARVSLSA